MDKTSTKAIRTSAGKVSVRESRGRSLPLVLLHGNSSSKNAFRRQFGAAIARHYRLVAIDLPGHGASEDARDPFTTYTLPGYAAVVREVLEALEIDRAVLCGWSLGGHVALELSSRWEGVAGLMLIGAPPASPTPESLAAAFRPSPLFPLLAGQDLAEADRPALAEALFGPAPPDFALDDLARCDGRSRRLVFESLFRGQAADERALVERAAFPVAIVNGADEPFTSTDYLGGLAYANLWRGALQEIAGAGHAPFWQAEPAFNSLLLSFLRDVAAASGPQAGSAPAAQRPVRPSLRLASGAR